MRANRGRQALSADAGQSVNQKSGYFCRFSIFFAAMAAMSVYAG
jgi:hypothetical protein